MLFDEEIPLNTCDSLAVSLLAFLAAEITHGQECRSVCEHHRSGIQITHSVLTLSDRITDNRIINLTRVEWGGDSPVLETTFLGKTQLWAPEEERQKSRSDVGAEMYYSAFFYFDVAAGGFSIMYAGRSASQLTAALSRWALTRRGRPARWWNPHRSLRWTVGLVDLAKWERWEDFPSFWCGFICAMWSSGSGTKAFLLRRETTRLIQY